MILGVIKNIIYHPLNRDKKLRSLLRFFYWQFESKVLRVSRIIQLTEKSRLNVIPGRPASTAHLYCGLFEFVDEVFLLHFLRRGYLFVDVGANVGVYSILGSSHCGANSISIEPIPETAKLLRSNIQLNGIEQLVQIENCGVSAEAGKILFTTSLDSANHAKSEEDDREEAYVEVATLPLDTIIGDRNPTLLKIDVEGFENEVLSGAKNVLSNKSLKAIIIELNGSGSFRKYLICKRLQFC